MSGRVASTAAVLALLAGVREVSADICEAGVWSGESDTSLSDSDNWVNGAVPTAAELAVVDSDDDTVITLDEDFSAYSLVIGGPSTTGDIVIEIGELVPVTLVIGEDSEAEPCVDSTTCGASDLTHQDGYTMEGYGSGVVVDTASQEYTVDAFNAFNVTCAEGFVPDTDVSFEVIECPFTVDNYTTTDFDSLVCVPYQSTYCSAGVLDATADSTWSSAAWENDRTPGQYVFMSCHLFFSLFLFFFFFLSLFFFLFFLVRVCTIPCSTPFSTQDVTDDRSFHRLDFAVLDVGSDADPVVVTLDSSEDIGGLIIEAGVRLAISDGVALGLAGQEPLCSDVTYCSEETLIEHLPSEGYEYEPLGTGISLDIFSFENYFNNTRGYNVSCADGWVAWGEPWMVIRCDSETGFHDIDANATLLCKPYESEWCSAALWDESDTSVDSVRDWEAGRAPTKFDYTIIASETYTNVDVADSFSSGALRIAGVMVTIGGGDSSTMITLGEEDALCSEAMCYDDDLLSTLTDRYVAFEVDSGQALDMNRGDLTNTSRGYNVSCARGCEPRATDENWTLVTCEDDYSFVSFDANASLQCEPIVSEFCPVSLWGNSSNGTWDSAENWLDGNFPNMFDNVILSSLDVPMTVTVDSNSAALNIEIGENGNIVIGGGEDAILVIGDTDEFDLLGVVDDDLCGENLCFVDDLVIPDGYVAKPLSSGINMDYETGGYVVIGACTIIAQRSNGRASVRCQAATHTCLYGWSQSFCADGQMMIICVIVLADLQDFGVGNKPRLFVYMRRQSG